jgi:hypothetical protein
MAGVPLMFLCFAVVALLVGIDGVRKGEPLRAIAGWALFALFVWVAVYGWRRASREWQERHADEIARLTSPTTRSWPMIVLGVLLALACFVGVGWILVAPYEELIAWSRTSGAMLRGLESAAGQWLGRLVYAALFAFAGGAAGYTAWLRLRS